MAIRFGSDQGFGTMGYEPVGNSHSDGVLRATYLILCSIADYCTVVLQDLIGDFQADNKTGLSQDEVIVESTLSALDVSQVLKSNIRRWPTFFKRGFPK